MENPYFTIPSSGPGSTKEYTKEFRECILSVIGGLTTGGGRKTVVDIGCGYWDYQSAIPWVELGVDYVGLDIKPDVVEHNTRTFGTEPSQDKGSIRFEVCDTFAKDYVPHRGDLYFIKDVLQHVSNLDIIRLLEKLRKTKARYLIANCAGQQSDWQDVSQPGDWRPLNYAMFPLKLFRLDWVFVFGTKHVYMNTYIPKPCPTRWPDYQPMNARTERVLLAILVKDKSHTLPLYLECIDRQTYPKHLISVYIRTNNNTDNSAQILREWRDKHEAEYERIVLEDQDVEQRVERFEQHEWNAERFEVLGKIRQKSIQLSIDLDCDWYFVIDADNFIQPYTLETLIDTRLTVVAPMLHMDWPSNHQYSNYHQAVDENGYFANSPWYAPVWSGAVKGLIQQPVVHTTYLIRKDVLPMVNYQDDSHRYEYVIFSDQLRKANIPQYLDNRHAYGYLTMISTAKELQEDMIRAKMRFSEQQDEWA